MQTERLQTIREHLNLVLDAAQTLRIQQVQATADWEQKYRDLSDAAWRQLNDNHEMACAEIGKLCNGTSENS